MNDEQIKRDNKAIANKKICFKVRATALRPRLHYYEGFHYPLTDISQRDLIKELQLGIHKIGVHNSTNSILYTRGSTRPI